MEDNPDGFVIETTLVEGYIKQSLNDAEPAAFVKVAARKADGAGELVQTVSTDKNGRYQFNMLKPGKYVIGPE